MKFIDTATIFIKAGKGGDGHVSFRREKYVPKGGPDGGNGGRGGNVILYGDAHLVTLLDFRFRRDYIADDGQPGGKNKCSGRDGEDLVMKLPLGTVVYDADTKEQIADIATDGQLFTIAKGGNGGHGNAMFATPTNQTPRYAKPGLEGHELNATLELKSIANVGIVGFPNVGKSTLISVISAAKPKIADYPFTTLIPNIGIVRVDDSKSFVVADIPGIIEGASTGKGLGIQFLRHIERTQILLFMLDALSENPQNDYKLLKNELKQYNPAMLKKKRIICFSRIDAITDNQLAVLQKLKFREPNTPIYYISAVANTNIEELKHKLYATINE
ncbi:MAG: GTPase ObgE [Ignavibacteria bacterium]|jgi:GTP-binding protein|nr:GTPase ObgE [Ignavibacteria bacterium]